MKKGSRGYIAISRGIFEHRLFKRRAAPLSRLEAWEWLIGEAAWKAEARGAGKGFVNLQRGQLAYTVRNLGKTWGWPKSNVSRFLKRLVEESMIYVAFCKSGTASGTDSGTLLGKTVSVITICNYDKYQFEANAGKTKAGHKVGQQAGQDELQLTLPPELFPSEPLEPFKPIESKKVAEAQKGQLTKPRHGAKGRGMVWFDHGTQEWQAHAADFREVRGVDMLPESRIGGRGNWFMLLGEATRKGRMRA